MADLMVRRGAGYPLADIDPVRLVRESMRRMQDMFREPQLDIDPFGYADIARLNRFNPDFEVRETADSIVFCADVPGVNESDIDVTVHGNRLRISGKREVSEETKGDTYWAAERSYGEFSRTFLLPDTCDTDQVCAKLENGVLSVYCGKRAESQARRIGIGQQQQVIEGQATEAAKQPTPAKVPEKV